MRVQTLTGEWEFRQADAEVGSGEWLPAQVPGGVHTDLMAAERIPDPFVADNEKQVMWVAEGDWEYRRTFSVDANVLGEAQRYASGRSNADMLNPVAYTPRRRFPSRRGFSCS